MDLSPSPRVGAQDANSAADSAALSTIRSVAARGFIVEPALACTDARSAMPSRYPFV